MNRIVFTIGYAGKTLNEFLICLKKNNIHYLLDVRSNPHSNTFPEFNKEVLSIFLAKNNIRYVSYGEYFGARRKEDETYLYTYDLDGHEREQVIFSEVYKQRAFKTGVQKVLEKLSGNWNVCFMCSEKEPVNCHRFWMVAFYFEYILKLDIMALNIIDENLIKTAELVFEEIRYEEAKKAFYKENEFEIEGYSLFGFKKPIWVEWWDKFYRKENNLIIKKQQFANYKIGYIRGNDEND